MKENKFDFKVFFASLLVVLLIGVCCVGIVFGIKDNTAFATFVYDDDYFHQFGESKVNLTTTNASNISYTSSWSAVPSMSGWYIKSNTSGMTINTYAPSTAKCGRIEIGGDGRVEFYYSGYSFNASELDTVQVIVADSDLSTNSGTHKIYTRSDWFNTIGQSYGAVNTSNFTFQFRVYRINGLSYFGFDLLASDDYVNCYFEVFKVEEGTIVSLERSYEDNASGGGDTTAAYNQGYSDGYSAGFTAGGEQGYSSGFALGEQAGYTRGYNDGVRDGQSYGYQNGYQQGLAVGLSVPQYYEPVGELSTDYVLNDNNNGYHFSNELLTTDFVWNNTNYNVNGGSMLTGDKFDYFYFNSTSGTNFLTGIKVSSNNIFGACNIVMPYYNGSNRWNIVVHDKTLNTDLIISPSDTVHFKFMAILSAEEEEVNNEIEVNTWYLVSVIFEVNNVSDIYFIAENNNAIRWADSPIFMLYSSQGGNVYSYQGGYDDGYADGVISGSANGYSEGRAVGYNEGYAAAEDYYYDEYGNPNTFGFDELMYSIADTPIRVVGDFLDFKVLGFNMKTFFFSLLTLAVVFLIGKLIVKFV